MTPSIMVRPDHLDRALSLLLPPAFWLGAWQLAAIWVDTVYTPGHGALLLPSPLLVLSLIHI